MKSIVYVLLLSVFLFSKELPLDSLLQEYEESESLYKKTKKESAGYLLVYSRVDLERMQAFHLRDVLKTVRVYNMQVNSTGAVGILNAGAGASSMAPIKLYIDDFEVSTVVQRNALDMYGEMDIYFVDHIEIYQGGSSIAFGNEPGSMVIKLYSKDPSRENSRSAQLSIDSNMGSSTRAVDAGIVGKYNYLFYANAEKLSYDTYKLNNQELSRDGKRYQLHFKVSKDDDFAVETDGIVNKTDMFKGFGTAPTGKDLNRAFGYINAIKYFPNNLELSISATQEVKEAHNTDANGIKLTDRTSTSELNTKVRSNTYKSAIKKKITADNSDLLIGAEVQRKVFDVKRYKGLNSPKIYGPDKLDVYMLYLEELYNLNKNNLLAFSAKLDRYEDSFDKNSNEYSLRLGYIGLLNNEWSTKIFAIRRYVYPSIFQTSISPTSYEVNPTLESSSIDMISGELEYNTDANRLVFGAAYKETDDAIALQKDPATKMKMYDNKEATIYFHRYYLRGEHYFNIDNKVIIEGFKAYKDTYGSPASGGLIQLFNTMGKFNIYNELVYREDITVDYGMGDVKTDASYDYTLGISYSINRHLKVKAKGENLLDKATVSQLDPQGLLEVPAIERRGTLTMEYTF